LILETTEDGKIEIIAMKLMDDEEFQAEIMDILDQY
jgi:hypothetical protein